MMFPDKQLPLLSRNPCSPLLFAGNNNLVIEVNLEE